MAKKVKIKKTLVDQILDKAKIDYDSLVLNALEGQLPPGIEENDIQTIKVYPNPVQHLLYIDNQEMQQYQIYSILGSKISEGTLAVGSGIDCSGLNSGVYLLSLKDGLGNVSTVKFVKQ